MQHKVVFTSDIHGNEVQYRKLVDYAIRISADSIIIGGDIAPKNLPDEYFITGQRRFLREKLPELLNPIKKELPNAGVFLIMGNDDCAANLDILEMETNLYTLIHDRRTELTKDFDIIGYSFVPITPFGIKDWEKYDLSDVPERFFKEYRLRVIANYKLSGFKSTKLGWKKFWFKPEMAQEDSIQKDLSNRLYRQKASNTICVFHAPPSDTNLDHLYTGGHAGSFAVRAFIEEHQPLLTLHGHLHETVSQSGEFKHEIGETLCLASGNHNLGSKLAAIVFDVYDHRRPTRNII